MPFPTEVVFTSTRNLTCSAAADDATSATLLEDELTEVWQSDARNCVQWAPA